MPSILTNASTEESLMSSIEENSDGYKSLSFSIHYDLFTPSTNKDDNYLNDDFQMALKVFISNL